MHSCNACQAQLLEYLYDLLDAAERQTLEAHLAACAECQAALAKARSQQQLLAAAAKMEFPTVAFERPAAPATLPLTAKTKSPARKWARLGRCGRACCSLSLASASRRA